MTPDEYVQRLTESLRRKMKLLNELFSFTQNQTDAINREDVESLNNLIKDKQKRLDEIDKIDEEFNVYFLRLKQTLKVSNLDEIKDQDIKGIKELQGIIGNVMAKIKEISIQEKQNNIKAQNLLNSIGNEIKKMNLGKKADSGYNPPPIAQPPAYFIDKKK